MGDAIRFNGLTNYGTIPFNSVFNLGSGMALVARFSGSIVQGLGPIISIGSGQEGGWSLSQWSDGNRWRFDVGGSGTGGGDIGLTRLEIKPFNHVVNIMVVLVVYYDGATNTLAGWVNRIDTQNSIAHDAIQDSYPDMTADVQISSRRFADIAEAVPEGLISFTPYGFTDFAIYGDEIFTQAHVDEISSAVSGVEILNDLENLATAPAPIRWWKSTDETNPTIPESILGSLDMTLHNVLASDIVDEATPAVTPASIEKSNIINFDGTNEVAATASGTGNSDIDFDEKCSMLIRFRTDNDNQNDIVARKDGGLDVNNQWSLQWGSSDRLSLRIFTDGTNNQSRGLINVPGNIVEGKFYVAIITYWGPNDIVTMTLNRTRSVPSMSNVLPSGVIPTNQSLTWAGGGSNFKACGITDFAFWPDMEFQDYHIDELSQEVNGVEVINDLDNLNLIPPPTRWWKADDAEFPNIPEAQVGGLNLVMDNMEEDDIEVLRTLSAQILSYGAGGFFW